MNCPHCGTAFHDQWDTRQLNSAASRFSTWRAKITLCPACSRHTIDLIEQRDPGEPGALVYTLQTLRVYSTNTFRSPTPKEVPAHIKEDYEEACKVLPISKKASAALSRRCLQAILLGQGYPQRDLALQIDALLNETDPAKAIPTALRQSVDAIRSFGNFSAHPVTDKTTLQIIVVEPEEAEWCLGILEDMFDHYYVKPEHAKARKAALDTKLVAAGKPRSK
jgi:hypothetical protein